MSDITLTSTHRAALRRLSRGEPLGDLDACFMRLLEAGLVDVLPDRAIVSDLGWRYLDESALAPTRRLPRPAPPTIPDGWRYSGDGVWDYEGRLTDGTLDVSDDEPDPDELAQKLEAAEAQVALLRYLRAVAAHTQSAARPRAVEDGDASSAPTPSSHGDGLADGWELLCDCDPCPHRGAP